jgi:hypothetical protein
LPEGVYEAPLELDELRPMFGHLPLPGIPPGAFPGVVVLGVVLVLGVFVVELPLAANATPPPIPKAAATVAAAKYLIESIKSSFLECFKAQQLPLRRRLTQPEK